MRRRVYIANTGGTIGMQPDPDRGYMPAPGHLADLMDRMPELSNPDMPAYTLHEYDPLLDSANMSPADWLRIANDIVAHYDDYDGFVVVHGTDSMAYTASALSFFLGPGLAKPVIVTGSMIPLVETRSDARENLITAMMIAAEYPIPEVCLFFGSRLFRGSRAVKVHATGFNAFDSPNYPPLGTVGVRIRIHYDRVRGVPADAAPPAAVPTPQPMPVVGALRVFPGITAQLTRSVLATPLNALVLEAYGMGNGPSRNEAFVEALAEAVARGVTIVDCTQCLRGTVDLSGYATGADLARAGVLSGYDTTVEAALAKLIFLYSQALPTDTIRELMGVSLCGEVTPQAK